jgi:hypothetical protein
VAAVVVAAILSVSGDGFCEKSLGTAATPTEVSIESGLGGIMIAGRSVLLIDGKFADYSAAYFEASYTLFPYAALPRQSSCLTFSDEPVSSTVYACPSCMEAKGEWKHAHPTPGF